MIRAENVHVRYRVYMDVNQSLKATIASFGRRRQFREVRAVRNISFEARAGEAVGVIGANGSGKTTLMRAIAGLLPVNKGAVYARATPMLLGVGAVLNKTLSGRRNILLGGLALGLTKDQVLEREDEIIDFAGIGDAIDLPMKTYSSGMSARLQFAISAAVKPEILIIDEALSVGDKDFKDKSNKKIQELREEAGTVFLVSHSMQSIRKTCSRVLWINQGKLEMDGDPEEVTEAYLASDIRRPRDPNKLKKRKKRLLRQKKRAERQLRMLSEAEEGKPTEEKGDPSDGSS
jgi:teichoic acid transport system ATP-binding protein